MNYTPKILAFAGSLRSGSYNKKLIRIAVEAACQTGAAVTHIDLRDFPLPVYDGDLESAEGLPEHAVTLKGLFKSNDGLLIASPEYNSSVPGTLKNVIDWVSRPFGSDPYLIEFTGKVAGIMSASPGALGGLRGLFHLRSILLNVGVLVLPDQVAIVKADNAFTADGGLKDGEKQAKVRLIAEKVSMVIQKLKG